MPANPSPPDSVRVLFVCLGNICRSPLAEGVFLHHARVRGVLGRIEVDSAGTGGWHEGEPPDPRSREVAERHGVRLEGAARKVRPEDFSQFNVILAMDRDNLRELERLREQVGGDAELRLLREYDPEADEELEVPDPYYGGDDGFETVFRMVDRSTQGLLDAVVEPR